MSLIHVTALARVIAWCSLSQAVLNSDFFLGENFAGDIIVFDGREYGLLLNDYQIQNLKSYRQYFLMFPLPLMINLSMG